MPTYVYQEVLEDGGEGECFEVFQSMSEAPLERHPETGRPVRRVYLPPNLGLKHSAGREAKLMDPKRTEAAGFTRYERDKGTGTYHKVSGHQGPSTLNP